MKYSDNNKHKHERLTPSWHINKPQSQETLNEQSYGSPHGN